MSRRENEWNKKEEHQTNTGNLIQLPPVLSDDRITRETTNELQQPMSI